MQNTNNQTVKYPLSSAGRRIGAKVIDILILTCIVMSMGFAIFCTDPNFTWKGPLQISSWRYGLFVSLMAAVFFGLMLLLPRLWKKTIGMKALNLSYYKAKECNFIFAIFKHELFIWEIVVIIAFVMGWTLSGLNQHQIDSLFQGANAIWASNMPEGVNKVCYYVGTGFSCFYGISILFLIAIIVAVCIKSGKPAFHDKYSHVYVIYKKQMQEKYVPVNKTNEHEEKVPGQLSDDSLEEIDNI